MYRVIPPATKGFNHSWVGWNGTRDGVFLWFCGLFYYLSYKLETKKQRNNKQRKHELITNKKDPINIGNIAETLQKCNLLPHTKTIQISNIKFASQQFNTSQIMETFCTEPLTINGTFQATFIPDFQKRKRNPIKFTYISFLNVTSETEDSALTQFVEEHVTVAGRPRYSMKNMPLLNTSLSLVCIEYSVSSKIFPDSISYSAYPSNARTQDNQIYITLEPTTLL